MRWIDCIAYAVGHVLNDLCASIWFTYTLVFFQAGIQLPAALSGIIMLIGQLADAVATPLVGMGSDQSQNATNIADAVQNNNDNEAEQRFCLCWWPAGRMGWHLGGSLLVIISFSFIFSPVYGGQNADGWAKVIYYAPFTVVFQIGWASVQISHLALMNDLTNSPSERVLLASMRYFFTVFSNLAVYSITFLLLRKPSSLCIARNSETSPFHLISPHTLMHTRVFLPRTCIADFSGNASEHDEAIDFCPTDIYAFRLLTFIVLGIGALFTLCFHLGIGRLRRRMITNQQFILHANTGNAPSEEEILTAEREPLINPRVELVGHTTNDSIDPVIVMRSFDWFKEPFFLILCPMYMFTRLIINISQVYITFYLLSSLLLPKASIALIPLTIYTVSAITSMLQKPLHDRVSREVASFLGVSFIMAFSVITLYPGSPPSLVRVYASAGLLGLGCTILLVTSLAMVGDLVGDRNQSTAAFVYGVMSFTDKLANGLVVQIIQILQPSVSCKDDDRYQNRFFYQSIESYGIMVFVGIFIVLLLVHLGFVFYTRVQKKKTNALVNRTSDNGSIAS